MKYINQEHRKISHSQNSGIIFWVKKFPFDKRIAIAGCFLISGTIATAIAWSGSSSDRIAFCINAQEEICTDSNNRLFRLTSYHWDHWELEGRSALFTEVETIRATNPYKPLESAYGFVCFSFAGWLLRQFQYDESQKTKMDAFIQMREDAINELKVQIDILEVARNLELSATDNAVIIQQAELLGEVEIKLTQMETASFIFDAETAGMTDEEKAEYVKFCRNQQTPYLTGTQTLEKTVNPKDKVTGEENKSIDGDWVSHAINHFCVLIFGGQGGGKTTAAGQIIKARKSRGDRVIVLDPHAERGQWEGLELIGAGMDYRAIDDFMKWYFEECERRYKLLRKEGKAAVQRLGQICVVAEELTNYAKRCRNSGDFIQACLSDNRKIFLNCLFISHGRTLSLMGGSQGTSKTRDDSFLELHCIPPTDGSPRRWEVKYPGGEFTPVQIPEWEMIFNFVQHDQTPERQKLEDIYRLEFDVERLKPNDSNGSSQNLNRDSQNSEPNSERLNPNDSNSSSQNLNRLYTPLKLTREQVLGLIKHLSPELTKTEIIEHLWACRKGGSAAWRTAKSEFRELTGDLGE